MPVDVEALHVTGDTVTDDNQILNTDAATDSTITPFFGGVGFGAAHSFYRLVPDISSQTFVGQTATIGADQRAASFSYPEGYRPLDRVNEFTSNYDKAIVSTFSRKVMVKILLCFLPTRPQFPNFCVPWPSMEWE